MLLERPSGNNLTPQNASTDNEDISLELAKILAKGDKKATSTPQNASTDADISLELAKILAKDDKQSTESTPEFLQQDEHEQYRPPSFQNFSSDSAQALLAKYEAGKTSIGSTGSGKINLVKYIYLVLFLAHR